MKIVPQNFLKAARVVLNWTQQDLSDQSGVSVGVIGRFEAGAGLRDSSMEKIILALTKAGVEFIYVKDQAIGLKLTDEALQK